MKISDARYGRSDEEEDDRFYISWLGQARTFIDLRQKEAQEFDNILQRHLPGNINHWECNEEGWVFDFDDLIIEVLNSESNPVEVKATSWSMSRVFIDPLRLSLRDLLSSQLRSCYGIRDFATILLRLAEEADIHFQGWKRARSLTTSLREVDQRNIKEYITTNPLGADLNTIETSADVLLGTSIKDICGDLPEEWRILHVEPVFRADLVSRFQKRQAEIYESLLERPYNLLLQCVDSRIRNSSIKNKQDLARELCKPKVTFHGTQRHKVSSIVRYGFVKPGDKAGATVVNMACGSSFGIGIYTSPYAEFAIHYAGSSGTKTSLSDLPGLRLIVCAVLMGLPLCVTREDTRRTSGIANEMAHSHVSPNELEYIVFDAAQILPCYVVHLDFGTEFAKAELAKVPENSKNWVKRKQKIKEKLNKSAYVAPGDAEAAKEARKAAAAKWFPYGYGPATGTSSVIEEIGEISDDEEDYGDYQGMRIEVWDEVSKWEESTIGTSWFDEYQKSRVTYGHL